MRGKTKIVSSVFLLSIMLASFFATFGVPTVHAQTTAKLSAATIVNPLLNPGDTVVVNILIDDVASLWSIEFTLDFDTNLLTPTGYFFNTAEPQLRQTFAADLNDADGYVHLGATRPDWGGRGNDFLGIGDGVTTTYNLANGVVEPDSLRPFYRVVNEFLGTAQTWLNPNTGLIENRDPGPWMGGGGDGKVDRMPILPSLATSADGSGGVERVYNNGALYASYGDPSDPRWITDYTTGNVKSSQVYEYRSRWPATGRTMTIDYATQQGMPAVASVDYAPSGGVGSFTLAAPANAGEEVWAQYAYRTGLTTEYALLVASIMFKVEARGVCPLHFESSSLLDQYVPGNAIAHEAVDGVFDNRLDATMSAPHIYDVTLTPDSYFDVYVSVGPWMGKDVEKLWGFQFIMDFDPSVIMAVDYETLGIFTPGPSEVGLDYVAVSGNSYYGDPTGLSTTGSPVPVARIGFVVLDTGVTTLHLHDSYLVDVDGATLVHEVDDGSFANVGVGAALTGLFLEAHKFYQTDSPMALTAQVKNIGLGTTRVRVMFTVLDPFGGVVAELMTDEARILPGTFVRLSSELDVTGLLAPSKYDVEATMQFLNVDGTWTTGPKGSPNSNKTTIVKSFTLLP